MADLRDENESQKLKRQKPAPRRLSDFIQLLDETEQNILIYQWRSDQLFADAEGRGK